MTDVLDWLFTFSSPYHAAWFLISMIGLVIPLLARPIAKTWHLYALIFHVVVVIEAVIYLAMDIGGQVFSVHCIWFNLLVSYGHWRLLVSRLRQKDGETGP
jgi:hypothetical protein